MKTLAARKGENAALVMAMSDKLERQIEAQIGADDGREMPLRAKERNATLVMDL